MLIWRYHAVVDVKQISLVLSSAAIGKSGLLHFVSSCALNVVCLEGSTLFSTHKNGTLNWLYSTGVLNETAYGLPIVDTEGSIYFGGSIGSDELKPGTLHAVLFDGQLKWNFTTDSGIYSTPAIDSHGVLFVLSSLRTLYAIHTNDGQLLWSANSNEVSYSFYVSIAIGNGVIFIGSYTHLLAIGSYQDCNILNPEYTATDMSVCVPRPTSMPSSSAPSSSSPNSTIPSSSKPVALDQAARFQLQRQHPVRRRRNHLLHSHQVQSLLRK